MSKDRRLAEQTIEDKTVEVERDKPVENLAQKKPVVMQTVYTHGKVFRIPADMDLDEFLRKQYPDEHRD